MRSDLEWQCAMYVANPMIKEAIRSRLIILLRSDTPFELIGMVTNSILKFFPEMHYSVAEDLVMQELIINFEDKRLDRLWHLYNVGYFIHDTQLFLNTNQQATVATLYEAVELEFMKSY